MNNNQYIFKLSVLNSYNINDFIVSSSNKDAYSCLSNWPENWGHLPFTNSLLLYGPISSGKTYLTKIWQQRSYAHNLKTNENFDVSILDKYSAFIIEDIEKWDEEKLLHYFNIINENKKYLLLTSSQLCYDFTLKDLESRINSSAKIKIESPDYDIIRIFLFKLFSQASVKASTQVQEFLIPRLPRQFNEIINFIAHINEFALSTKRNFSIPLVKDYLLSKNILD